MGASGIGGSFRNSFADTSQALIVRNAADSNTTFSVQSNGFVSALAFSGDGTNLTNLQALNFTGTLSAANGGTGSSTAQDDRVMVGNGASWQQRILPDCDGSSQKLLYDTATNVFSCATEAGTSSVQRPNTKRWSYIAANGAGNFTATGDAVTLSGGTGTLGPSASTPASTQLPTAAVLNDFNAVNGNLVYSNSANQTLFQAKVAMSGTTSIRVWAIIASTTPATIVTTSMPAVNFAGFRYDTSAGDSNWQCVTNDAGLAGTVQDSGVAPSGSAFDELQVTTTTTSAVFSIDGVQVCSINTNVPVSGADFRYNASVTALSASARSLFVAWIYEESD